ncbi:DUF2124 family protein [Methanobacterium sp.]
MESPGIQRSSGSSYKIAFAGTLGVCIPFAELFAYVVRDKESIFIN